MDMDTFLKLLKRTQDEENAAKENIEKEKNIERAAHRARMEAFAKRQKKAEDDAKSLDEFRERQQKSKSNKWMKK